MCGVRWVVFISKAYESFLRVYVTFDTRRRSLVAQRQFGQNRAQALKTILQHWQRTISLSLGTRLASRNVNLHSVISSCLQIGDTRMRNYATAAWYHRAIIDERRSVILTYTNICEVYAVTGIYCCTRSFFFFRAWNQG